MTAEPHRRPPNRGLVETGVMAILRAASAAYFPEAAQTLADAGITCLEITMTTPGCLDAVREVRRRLPDTVAVGVGTVLSTEEVRAAAGAGAGFVVSPGADPDVIACSVELGMPCYPGGWTPTEVLAAWRAGASAVKIFPASSGGVAHLTQLRGPFPDIPMIPTGGVRLDTMGDYLRAGALAVGIGGAMLGPASAGGQPSDLATRARHALTAAALARRTNGGRSSLRARRAARL